MKRLLIFALAVILLAPAAAPAAKEKAEKPAAPAAAAPAASGPNSPGSCPLMGPGQGGGGMDAARWWRIGAMSTELCEILKKANGILIRDNLSPDAQKQVGLVLEQLGVLVPVIFYPQEVQKPEEMMKQLKELEAVLEKLEAQGRGK